MAKARTSSGNTRRIGKSTSGKAGTAPASAAQVSAAAPAAPAPTGKARAARGKPNGPAAQQFDQPQVVMAVSHDEIARRAYEIWLRKGRPMGQDDQNWREAEAALRTELAQAPQ